jgi:hypothetical protein
MGKESRLRNNSVATRQSYSNGDRKFYDKNACPAGADEYVWSLALYFEQRLEDMGVTSDAKTPVVYTWLYEEVARDPDLTSLLDSGTLHISDKGEGVKPVTGSDIHQFLVDSIDYYFNNYSSNKEPTIYNYCSSFKEIKLLLLQDNYYKLLSTKGTKVPVVTTGTPQPDKRSTEVREVLDITVNRVYTEQDMEKTFTNWRGGQH